MSPGSNAAAETLSVAAAAVTQRQHREAPFAVKIQIRPPVNRQPGWGALLKGVFDGVIEAHIETTNLPEVTVRLATALPADATEIEKYLLDQRRAVLGAVNKLVRPTGRASSGILPIIVAWPASCWPLNRSMTAGRSRATSSNSPVSASSES